MNALTKYAAKQHLLEKLAKKKKKDEESGHLKPGTTAMIGALLGPTGAGIGAELGSPGLRAAGGSIVGVPAGALAGALAGAGIAVTPRALKLALLKLRHVAAPKGFWRGGKRRALAAKIDALKGGLHGTPFKDSALKGGLAGGGLGALAGYFEGARRGAESVKYKGK
jgi:hypothetical protein